MIIFALLLSLQTFAATESMDAFEQTFGRDNTFCTYKGKRVQIILKGHARQADSREQGYGEYFFYDTEDTPPLQLPLNQNHDNSYRFFLGTSPLCSKSHGYLIDENTMAILILKENRPFLDKLVIQLFDTKTLLPKNFVETDYPTDKAKLTKKGFAFRYHPEVHEPELGKVTINGESFIYHEKIFDSWIEYSKDGFEVRPDLTFEGTPWAKRFKKQEDFLAAFGWNPKEKKFLKTIVYEAVNHKLKRECLLVSDQRQKLSGSEPWNCQDK